MVFYSSTIRSSVSFRSIGFNPAKLLASTLVALGLVASASPQSIAQTSNIQIASSSQVAQAAQRLENGIYLYGQSPEPEQIGAAYMVFEVSNNQVVGAFYMPQSSFDCFYGDFQGERLALNVVDSYEQSVSPYSIALESNASVASTGQTAGAVSIEGFHPIASISPNDQRILSTCQADYQQRQQ